MNKLLLTLAVVSAVSQFVKKHLRKINIHDCRYKTKDYKDNEVLN